VRLNSHGSGKGILPPVLVQRARHQEKKQGSCQFAPDGDVCHDSNTTMKRLNLAASDAIIDQCRTIPTRSTSSTGIARTRLSSDVRDDGC